MIKIFNHHVYTHPKEEIMDRQPVIVMPDGTEKQVNPFTGTEGLFREEKTGPYSLPGK